MNFLDKIAIKTGITRRNNFDLSSDHMTTMDFFQIRPVLVQPVVPKGVYNIKASTFTRLTPMSEPMMGSCRIVNRAFFVPNRVIMDCWNSFITDTTYSATSYNTAIPTSVTTVTGQTLVQLLLQGAFSSTTQSSTCDFIDYTTPGTPVNKLFTSSGRRAFNILWSLGYKIPIADITRDAQNYSVTYSALPLLAYLKIYKDWYANQAYDTAFLDSLFYKVNYSLNVSELTQIFNFISMAMYDKDYFTAASDNPVVPNSSLSSNYTINDISNDTTGNQNKSVVRSLTNSNSTGTTSPSIINVAGGNSAPVNITQYLVDQLKALTDYLHRNQLVGSRAADRMMARFGIRPNEEALRLSVPIGKDVIPIQISDVMATSSSTTSQANPNTSLLGDYAGKGIGYGSSGFRYESKEYGYIIVVSVIIPKVGYVQGASRNVTSYLNRLDFWTPEFDGKSGNQAIRFDELKSDFLTSQMVTVGNKKPDDVWGFIPRWSDLKCGFDNMTGDFAINSRNAGLEAWHTFRLFGYRGAALNQSDLNHNSTFTIGQQEHYDRIFAYIQNTFDHFIMGFHFDINASLPMAKMYDTYEFDGGKEVTMEVNGTQFE